MVLGVHVEAVQLGPGEWRGGRYLGTADGHNGNMLMPVMEFIHWTLLRTVLGISTL